MEANKGILICICALLIHLSVCARNPVRDCVQDTYLTQVGVREKTGNNDGVEVEKYLKSCKLGKGYAWCSAFVNWCMNQCSVATKSSAWAPSWFDNDHLIYKRGMPLKSTPQKGDLFGLYYVNLKRIGHVGFIDEWGDDVIITVEGNTNEVGSREGDGVYRKRRLKSQIYVVADWITQ